MGHVVGKDMNRQLCQLGKKNDNLTSAPLEGHT
ncbi:MAG: hypothetical protein PWP34_923 [Desulfuromonadales bacterium]|jgi:hypothetical protein|nr:hypothetical protein [Desulfuromonadales bacterium]